MIFGPLIKSKNIFHSSFLKFANTLIKVQDTSSSLAKKAIINEYYETCKPEQQTAVLSILNFIRDKPKTGLADKSLSNFIANRYFQNQQQSTENDFQSLIDQLQDTEENPKGQVQLKQVQRFLQELIGAKGNGSMKLKLEKLSSLIDKMTLVQIKIILRILAKKLRIGLTDKSFEFKKQQQLKKEEQESQNNPNSSIKMPNFEPMLAKPLKNLKDVYDFCQKKENQKLIADLKYDGERTLICYKKGVGFQLMSRRKKMQTSVYESFALQLKEELDKIQDLQSIQIDGQIVCVTDNQQPLDMRYLLNKRGKSYHQATNEKIIVFGFDVLEYNGESLLNNQLIERRHRIPKTEHIRISQFIEFKYPEEKQKLLDYYKKVLERKHEGLIIKGEKDLYFTNGSRRHWGKFKKGCKIQNSDTGQIDLDLVLMGVSYGQGKRSPFFAAYLVGVYHEGKLFPVCKVGTGFTDEQLQQYTQMFKQETVTEKPAVFEIPESLRMDYYMNPKYVFKVTCQDLSRSPLYKLSQQQGEGGISLRFPVFECIRDDKDPKSCTSNDLFEYIDKK